MADKMCENNQVTIMGEIVSDFSYSHEVYGGRIFIWWKYLSTACPVSSIIFR